MMLSDCIVCVYLFTQGINCKPCKHNSVQSSYHNFKGCVLWSIPFKQSKTDTFRQGKNYAYFGSLI